MTQNEARSKCTDYILQEKETHKSILQKYTFVSLTILAVSLCILTICRLAGFDTAVGAKIVLAVNGLNAIFYLGAAWPRFEGMKNCNLAKRHLESYGFRGDCVELLKQYQRYHQQ